MLNDSFTQTIERDFFRTFCGDLLGSGSGREVYSCLFDEKYVIKFEPNSYSFQNISEWRMWQDVEHTDHVKWFAPCKSISPCGTVLIMQRTKPAKRFPKELPLYFTDTKKENFGMIGNRFVCHDYGFTRLFVAGLTKRTRVTIWHDE